MVDAVAIWPVSFDRSGNGAPLLLIHGSGGDRRVWDPVVAQLALSRDVIAVDLPGHGRSPVPPAGTPPTPAGYARILLGLLRDLNLSSAHVAGISVGGWTALELAKLGGARSVTAFSPAGLWRKDSPRATVATLWLNRRLSRAPAAVTRRLLISPAGRKLALGRAVGKPTMVPTAAAIGLVQAFASAPGFDEHLAMTRHERFTGGQALDVSVTIAFGDRDRLLTKRKARFPDQLPGHTRWLELPGCGHVPTWDDASLIVQTILEGMKSRPG